MTMPTDWPELITAIEAAFLDIMRPDLLRAGVAGPYIVRASLVDVPPSVDWIGGTNPYVSATYRDVIGERWQGLGPAAILNDTSIDEGRAEFFEDRIPLAVAIAAHELFGHTYQFGFCKDLPEKDRNEVANLIKSNVQRPTEEVPPDVAEYRDSLHDWKFIRRVFHGAHRLERMGWDCPRSQVLAWEWFGYSSPESYRATLGDEFERLESLSLSQITEIAPPRKFVELYLSDLASIEEAAA